MIPKVKVVKAKISKISKIEKLVGEIVAKNKVTISSTVEGPIVFCPWNEGDIISRGTTLVQIRRPVYEKEVDVAAASLSYSVSKLKDLKAGFRPEEISQAKENIVVTQGNEKLKQGADVQIIGEKNKKQKEGVK